MEIPCAFWMASGEECEIDKHTNRERERVTGDSDTIM